MTHKQAIASIAWGAALAACIVWAGASFISFDPSPANWSAFGRGIGLWVWLALVIRLAESVFSEGIE